MKKFRQILEEIIAESSQGSEARAPFFVYDLEKLRSHLKETYKTLSPHCRIFYAQKANPLSAILEVIREEGYDIDVAGTAELGQAIKAGFSPQQIIATGPAKNQKYLGELCHKKVNWVVCESINQLIWLDKQAKKHSSPNKQCRPQALLRVQFRDKESNHVLGGGDASAFGLPPEEWPKAAKISLECVDIRGFHFFQWGNIQDVSFLEEKWAKGLELLHPLREQFGLSKPIVDMGGGLGIPYGEGDQPVDLRKLAQILANLKKKFNVEDFWLELGRYLVGECGVYVNQIIDRKAMGEKDLLILTGGINHIARSALTGSHFPVSALESYEDSGSEKLQRFGLHGPLCTALDFLGDFELPANLGPGDWLVFSHTGAYGFTESLPFFLCHDGAEEYIWDGKNSRRVRESLSPQNWMR